jgi:YD repeat-containing protein
MQFGVRQNKIALRRLALGLSSTFLWSMTAPALAGSGTKERGHSRTLSQRELQQIRGMQGSFGEPGGMPASKPAREDDAGSTYPWEASAGGTNTVNRNKLTTILVVSWSARGGMAVSLNLYHNSKANRQTELGYQWTHSYDIYGSLEATTGDLLVQWGDNLNYTFTKNIDGSYSAPGGIFETLTYNATTDKYTLTKKDQTVVTFSKGVGTRYNGSSIADRNGNTITINHNSADYVTSVVDPTGRTLSFTYSSGNRLTSVTDPAGRVFSFAFNSQDNLTSVTYPTAGSQTPVVSFGYNAQHSITSLTDARGKVWTMGYDSSGKGVTWEKNPLNQQTGYAGGGSDSTVTDALGNATSYSYDFDGRLAAVTLPGWSSISYGYNASNLRTSVTDAKMSSLRQTRSGTPGRLPTMPRTMCSPAPRPAET